jgi:hypothetical protein
VNRELRIADCGLLIGIADCGLLIDCGLAIELPIADCGLRIELLIGLLIAD